MQNFSLKAKLLLLTFTLCAVALVIGATGYVSLGSVSNEYGWIATKTMPKMEHLDQMFLNFRKIRANLTLTGLPDLPEIQLKDGINDVNQALTDYEKENETYTQLGMDDRQKELYEKLHTTWVTYKKLTDDILALQKTGSEADKAKMVQLLYNDIPAKAKVYAEAAGALAAYHKEVGSKKVQSAESIRDRATLMVVMIAFGGVVFGSVFGFLFSTNLAKTLNRISDDIYGAASQTAAGGAHLASASVQLSAGSTEGAASLEETVASLEELSSMVKLNTSHAQEANGLSQNSKDAAEKGAREIEQLIYAMNEISSGSKQIEEIISVIDDIAFQTNLLALNAAVEAARAGEQGKGFAVVADAVRTLAQKSAESAKGITSLIKENVEKTEKGSVIASNSGTVLVEILNSVKKVADLNKEISTSSSEQANGIEQISKAMNQLDQATQSNAASSEEVAASSEEMSAQAQALNNLVGELQVLIHGKKNTNTIAPQEVVREQPVLAAA
ncbi:methyl-accepting chemotaxis protein [Bdellovibrio sp. SKB1291214]|uniref:HAMP domain-containing methyl-accepting chemotaxis protein n=1 Tax=Bdellovibrio sp. SKB1291214 TaxID=1732569 RepID=UPI0020CE959B|nr:methyl-accepting chemotaxis protein [Bdellovibrio sp. SKB1291214]UYL07447.1 methyl-accepting chemotaxis protein [Bdellovibrio sp. SKB1291214]